MYIIFWWISPADLRVGGAGVAALRGASAAAGDASLPQQQHAVGHVGRQVPASQRVKRHAGDDAGRDVELDGQLEPGAPRDVPRQALQASSGEHARLPCHCTGNNAVAELTGVGGQMGAGAPGRSRRGGAKLP